MTCTEPLQPPPAITRGLTNLLSPAEAAAILGVTVGTLSVWRCTRRYNLPFVKIGRTVKYRPQDIEEYIDRQAVEPVDR